MGHRALTSRGTARGALAGEGLVARFDLKADRARGTLNVLSCRFESTGGPSSSSPVDTAAASTALERYSASLGLEVRGWRAP